MKEKHFSIWFIIGLQLLVLGLLVFGVSVYDVWFPPPTHTVFENLHAGIYWGVLLFLLGLFYTLKYRRPGREP